MEDDNIPAAGFHAIQNIRKMIESVHIADGYQNISGARTDGFRSQFAFRFQVELVHFDVGRAANSRKSL